MTTFFKKNFIFFLLIFFTIPTFYSLIRPGFFWMQDDLQAFRIFEMDRCFKDLQIPCRWVPDAGYQYGYPQFEFYPPSVYYLGELIHLIGFQFIDVVKILFILGFIISALAMFLFLRDFLGIWPAFIGSLLYIYVPYRAVEVYVRGAMSEFWSLAIFPFVFWSLLRLIKTGNSRYIGLLAISIGLLLTTHNLMSLIFFPAVLIWGLSLVILENNFRHPEFIRGIAKILYKLLFASLLGIGLAAFFTLPLLFERQFVHLDTLVGGYFDYRAHFVDIKRLLLQNDWGYGSSNIDPKNELNLSTGIIHWLVGLLAVFLAAINFKKFKKIAIITFIVAAVETLNLFMIHQKSSFIWSSLSFMEFLQFPWRFLSVSIFLLSVLSAITFYFLKEMQLSKKLYIIFGIIIVGLVFILYASFFSPKIWYDISDQDKFSGKSWEKQLTISIFDYLPIFAKFPPVTKAPSIPEVLKGRVIFLNYQKGSNFQFGNLDAKEDSLIRLPLFDYPGMVVLVDDKKIEHIHDDCRYEQFCLGLVSFEIPKGQHTVKVQLIDTPIRMIANTISLISLLVISFVLVKGIRYEKNIS